MILAQIVNRKCSRKKRFEETYLHRSSWHLRRHCFQAAWFYSNPCRRPHIWITHNTILPHRLHKTLEIKRFKWVWWINEPFHWKTYNLDWRHNLLKRCHKLAGKILTYRMIMVHEYFRGLVICIFFLRIFSM